MSMQPVTKPVVETNAKVRTQRRTKTNIGSSIAKGAYCMRHLGTTQQGKVRREQDILGFQRGGVASRPRPRETYLFQVAKWPFCGRPLSTGHCGLVLQRCPFRSEQHQEFRSIVQFPFCCPRLTLTIRNKLPFPIVVALDDAFSSSLGNRNEHLPSARQTRSTFHGNNCISSDLPARRSSQDVIVFYPHSRRNCCGTSGENKAQQNESAFHVLPSRQSRECINRDNYLKQFLPQRSQVYRGVRCRERSSQQLSRPFVSFVGGVSYYSPSGTKTNETN